MSLMAMNRTVKKFGPAIIAVLGVVMVVGAVGYNMGGGGGGRQRVATGANVNDPAVATVGDRKITQNELEQAADRLIQQQMSQNPMMAGKTPPPEARDSFRLGALEGFKQQAALLSVAKAAGIEATDADIRAERDRQWNENLRASIAKELKLKADATDTQIESALISLGNGASIERLKTQFLPADNLRLGVLVSKLSNQYKTQIAVTDAAVKQSLSDMTVRHILIKFGTGALPEEQAKNKAQKLLAAVKANPATMAALARENSDDGGSKAKGGVYEWTPAARQGIVPEMVAALDTLKPGETYPELVRVSNPGYSGFHIVRLEAAKPGKDFPQDFDKNKAQYLTQYGKERTNKRIQSAVDAAIPSVTVLLSDPLLQVAQTLANAEKEPDKAKRDALLQTALTELGKIKRESDALGIAPLRRAQIYTALGKPKDAIAAYEDALTYRKTPEVRLALAQAYLGEKQNDKVKEQLAELEKGAIPEPQMQAQIAQLYTSVGDTAKAKAADAKAKEMQKLQMEAIMKQFQAQQPVPAPGGAAPAPKPTK